MSRFTVHSSRPTSMKVRALFIASVVPFAALLLLLTFLARSTAAQIDDVSPASQFDPKVLSYFLDKPADDADQPDSDNSQLKIYWLAPDDTRYTQALAWADVDGDGDLDLAVGNDGTPDQLYRNVSGTLLLDTGWNPLTTTTTSLAWGDVDQDGNLDLAVGNSNAPSQLYLNNGGKLELSNNSWSPAPPISDTSSVAWGDIDGDGWLDLVVGNYDQPSLLYHNAGGTLVLDTGWNPISATTNSLALGDIEGDGDLDLVMGNYGQPNRLYRNVNGMLVFDSSFTPTMTNTKSVALGDIEGDSDLDLVVGNDFSPNQLYRYTSGTFVLDPNWQPPDANTLSVALGDVDGDGDLDLAVGNYLGLYGNQLYRNMSGTLRLDPDWQPPIDWTTSVAWGDVNSDGHLDLAVGNFRQSPNRIYGNIGRAPLAIDTNWGIIASVRSLAWGDIDSDGDLDLAVGNDGGPGQLYRNDGGVLILDTQKWSPLSAWTSSLAWGDIDSDGDLDLAVGNDGGPGQLYRNDGGVLILDTQKWSPLLAWTSSLAWGDVDGDGDLDLAVGNDGAPNQLYRNVSGTLLLDTGWNPLTTTTTSLAWGDLEADGDLDLVVGNRTDPNQIYRNIDGRLVLDTTWNPEPANGYDWTTSLALGDIDGDGDLDLVVGNGGNPATTVNQLYRNVAGRLILDTSWLPEPNGTTSLALGDIDGDRDLDLIVGNTLAPSQIYLNDHGTLTLDSAWLPPADDPNNPDYDTESVALGDIDRDGDLDLALGNDNLQSQLYRNGTQGVDTLPNQLPRVVVNRPATDDAPFFSSAKVLDSRIIPITYTLSDAEGNDVRLLRAFYSLDGGGHWLRAVEDSNLNQDLIAYWKFDEGTGNLAIDSSRHGQTGELFNGPTYTTSVPPALTESPWALQLDGVNDYMKAPLVTPQLDGMTLAAWVKWSGPTKTGQVIVYNGDTGANGYGLFVLDDQRIAILVGGIVFLSSDVQLPTNSWQHLAAIRRHGTWELYVNGVSQELTPADWINVTPNAPTQGTFVGSNHQGGENFKGLVDDVRIYKRALSDSELRQLMAGSTSTLGTGLSFEGLNDVVVITTTDVNMPPPWTAELWVNRQPSTKISAVLLSSDQYAIKLEQCCDTGQVGITHYGFWDQAFNYSAPIGEWTHLAIVGTDSGTNLYANGDLIGTLPYTIEMPISLLGNRVATGATFNDSLKGTIDEVRLWHVARTPQEIRATMLKSLTGQEPGLVAYWPLDEGAGTVAFDRTVNHWNGVLGGGDASRQPAWRSGLLPVPVNNRFNNRFNWDTFASSVFGQSDNVVLRLEAYPGVTANFDSVPGPFQRPYVFAQTLPFRVQGTQVRVLSDTRPISGAIVYRLPAAQTGDARPLASSNGQPFLTDKRGYLSGRGQLDVGDRLVALLPISATKKYTVYATSVTPTLTGLTAYTVTQAGVQTLTVSMQHPLVLFQLKVSLEWDARKDQQFLTQLEFDLQRVSELLFDWTNGQAALGQVNIYHNRDHWRESDVQLFATNRLRPFATEGGSVTRPTAEVITATQVITYRPGHVHIGAVWNRFGDPTGTPGEDWPRALAHELGHYFFFMDDNYLGVKDGIVVPVDTCEGSAMSDPYRDEYSEFHGDAHWRQEVMPARTLENCEYTLSNHTLGRSDWSTLVSHYPWLNKNLDNPGPSSLPLAVTQITEVDPGTPLTTLDLPIFYLKQANGSRVQPGPTAQAFLYQGDRLIDLGGPTVDKVRARGAQIGDRVCVYEWAANRRGCTTIQPNSSSIQLVTDPSWHPEILLSPINTTTLKVGVRGMKDLPAGSRVYARLFPLNGGPSVTTTLSGYRIYLPLIMRGGLPSGGGGGSSGQFDLVGTLTSNDPVLEGYVQIWVDEPEPRREIVASYALGGNPVAAEQIGFVAAEQIGFAPGVSPDGQVILYGDRDFPLGEFFTLQAATALPVLPPGRFVVGQGYWLSASEHAPSLQGTSINFRYLESQVPAGEEAYVDIYRWDGQKWTALVTQRDTLRHHAFASVDGPGLYALMSSVDLPLFGPGWNQFTYPVQGSKPIAQALLSISGYYTTVYGLILTDAADPWKVYDVTAPDWVNDLTTLDFGRNYWINVSQSITLYLTGGGTAAPSSANALPSPPMTFYGPVITSTNFTPISGSLVTAWINGQACGKGKVVRSSAGQLRYTFNVIPDGPGGSIGCGAPGRDVTFTVEGQATAGRVAWNIDRVWYLPLQSSNQTALPDLVVRSIQAQSNQVQVVIANQGTVPVRDEFWIDLYVDPNPAPTGVNQIWNDGRSTYGGVWGVPNSALSQLGVGGALTLTLGDAYYWPTISHWPALLPLSTPLYAQVDSANANTTYGAVLETHEAVNGPYNNISHIIVSRTVSPAAPNSITPERAPLDQAPRP